MTYPKEWLIIANRALNLVGERELQNFESEGENCKNVLIQLPSAIQEVLCYYPWRCVRKRATLAPVVSAPVYGFDYAYQLPNDFVCLVSVDTGSEFSLEGDKILCDDASFRMTYVELPALPGALTPVVQELIVYLLAYKLAQVTTSNDALIARLYQSYQVLLLSAKCNDEAGCQQNIDGDDWWSEQR